MANSVDLGSVVARLELDVAGFQRSINDVKSSMSGVATHTQKSASVMGSALDSVAKVGMAGLAVATTAAMALVATSIGSAVKRVDTLDNSARTFENMGIKASDAKEATKRLTESILGLPTPLDSAVRGMTDLTATYGDVNTGQKVFSALNNAILGFGGTTDSVRNAVTQLSQLPMDGPLDGQTWLSLRNSGLTPVLVAMAEDMGIGIGEMREKFMSGQLTVRDFTNKLIEMNEKGGGGMKSLQQIARDSTKGIGTSIENMKTAVTRGIASILRAIGTEDIAKAITAIGTAFETALKGSSGFIQFIKDNQDFIRPVLIALTTFVALTTVVFLAIKAGTAVVAVWNAVWAANPIILVALAVIALTAGLAYFFTKTETGRKIWEKLTESFNKFWEAVKPIRDFIGDQLISAFDSLKSIWKQLSDSMQPLIDKFKEFWSEHGDKVVQVLKYIGLAVGLIVLAPLIQSFIIFLGALKLVSSALKFVADHFEGLKDIVVLSCKVAFLPIYLAILGVQKAMDLLGVSWGDVWNAIVSVARTSKDGVVAAFKYVQDKIKTVQDAFDNFKTSVNDSIQKVQDKIQEFKVFIGTTVETVKTKWKTFTESVDQTKTNVNESIDKMKAKMTEWKILLQNGFDGGEGTEKLLERLNGVNKGLSDSIMGIITPYKDAISGIWDSAGTSMQAFLDSLPGKWESFKNTMSSAWDSAYATVSTFFTNAWDSAFNFVTNLPTTLSGIWQAFQKAWDQALEATKTFFRNLFTNTKEDTDKAGEDTAGSMVDGAKKKFSDFETIRKVGDAILTMIVLAIALVIVYAIDAMIRFGKNLIEGLGRGIMSMGSSLWGAISTVSAKIGEFFAGVGNWLYDSGRALFFGFINGMKSVAGSVKDTASGILKSVRNLFPSSPAKEGPFSGKGWTKYSGIALVQGFEEGISSQQSRLANVMASTFPDIAGTVNANLTSTPSTLASPAAAVPGANTVSIYGNINISNQADADYLLSRLSRRQDLTVQGLVGA